MSQLTIEIENFRNYLLGLLFSITFFEDYSLVIFITSILLFHFLTFYLKVKFTDLNRKGIP